MPMLQFYNPRERSEEFKWYEVAIPLSIQMVDPLQIPVAFLGVKQYALIY